MDDLQKQLQKQRGKWQKQLQKQRGKWLEHFLNPSTRVKDFSIGSGKNYGFLTLAREAIEIMGVHYEHDIEKDAFIVLLDNISTDQANFEWYFPKNRQERSDVIAKIMNGDDPLRLMENYEDQILSFKDGSFYRFLRQNKRMSHLLEESRLEVVKRMMGLFYTIENYRGLLQDLFSLVAADEDPWSKTLCKSDNPFTVHEVYQAYSRGISKAPFYSDGQVSVRFLLLASGKKKSDLIPPIMPPKPTYFPWDVVSSTIAIDFLENGGQTRFLLCERCGRFKCIKRKNKPGGNLYCSDKCRVTAGKKPKSLPPIF